MSLTFLQDHAPKLPPILYLVCLFMGTATSAAGISSTKHGLLLSRSSIPATKIQELTCILPTSEAALCLQVSDQPGTVISNMPAHTDEIFVHNLTSLWRLCFLLIFATLAGPGWAAGQQDPRTPSQLKSWEVSYLWYFRTRYRILLHFKDCKLTIAGPLFSSNMTGELEAIPESGSLWDSWPDDDFHAEQGQGTLFLLLSRPVAYRIQTSFLVTNFVWEYITSLPWLCYGSCLIMALGGTYHLPLFCILSGSLPSQSYPASYDVSISLVCSNKHTTLIWTRSVLIEI